MSSPAANFSGTDGVSAARWLRSLKLSLPTDITSASWLSYVDSLLTGEAAIWADQHPRVRRILTEDYMINHATEADVVTVKKALGARFPVSQECSSDHAGLQLMFLRQGDCEDMTEYHRRTEVLLHAVGGVDALEAPLTVDEEASLKSVVLKFILGLRNDQLRETTLDYWRRDAVQATNSPPGLEECFRFAKCVYDDSQFIKATFEEAAREGSDARLSQIKHLLHDDKTSSPPELSFTGLFGSLGDLHDAYTKAAYRSYDTSSDSVYLVGNHGIARIGESLAKHYAESENGPDPQDVEPNIDAVVSTVSKGKARLVHILPSKKKLFNHSSDRPKYASMTRPVFTGTPLSDVDEEDSDASSMIRLCENAPRQVLPSDSATISGPSNKAAAPLHATEKMDTGDLLLVDRGKSDPTSPTPTGSVPLFTVTQPTDSFSRGIFGSSDRSLHPAPAPPKPFSIATPGDKDDIFSSAEPLKTAKIVVQSPVQSPVPSELSESPTAKYHSAQSSHVEDDEFDLVTPEATAQINALRSLTSGDILFTIQSQKATRGTSFGAFDNDPRSGVADNILRSTQSSERLAPIPPLRSSSQAYSHWHHDERNSVNPNQNERTKNGNANLLTFDRKEVGEQNTELTEEGLPGIPNFSDLTSGQRLSWGDPYLLAPPY